MNKPSVISASPDILGGILVFRGTRVPVRTLFDYFEKGSSLADFHDDFPTVMPAQTASVLEECLEMLLNSSQSRGKTVIPEGGVRSSADVHALVARAAALGPTSSLAPGADSREAIYSDHD